MQNTKKIHKAKKSLGQNFLKSALALRKIIEAGEIKKDDIILEIGPGRGVLTKKLLEKSEKVVAVEKDRELFDFLKIELEKEIAEKKLILINDNILNLKVEENILRNYKIIANIPYNITGAILKKFLTDKNQPERMILMVQREVAGRMIARDGKESLLSISVKAYGEPKMIMKVPARYFSPAPKVDSAVIAIKNISRKFFTQNSPLEEYPKGEMDNASTPSRKRVTPQEGNNNFEDKFWEIVKTGFAHKRKKLSGNLKNYIGNSYVDHKRAEDLSLGDWIKLAKNLNINKKE